MTSNEKTRMFQSLKNQRDFAADMAAKVERLYGARSPEARRARRHVSEARAALFAAMMDEIVVHHGGVPRWRRGAVAGVPGLRVSSALWADIREAHASGA